MKAFLRRPGEMREQCALLLITGSSWPGKPYPSGRGYDLVLYLRDAKERHLRIGDMTAG
jgi:hypothetical protein